MKLRILPPDELIEDGVVTLPLSKSLGMRALLLAALTGERELPADGIAVCDDTAALRAAIEAWRALPGGQGELTVDVGASGAALRFLCAFLAALPGVTVTLGGCDRLCQRPMRELVEALRQCGADIEYLGTEGHAPLKINGKELEGGTVTVDVTVSSQFISALLMVAPLMRRGLEINFDGEPVSLPYITMTLGMMEKRGVTADREPLRVKVEPGSYRPVPAEAEGDWSAAAFWYEISALSSGWIRLANLRRDSLQGDRAAERYFECLGVTTEEPEDEGPGLSLCPSPEVYGRLDLDLTDNPDLAPALAATACFIGVPFRLTGLKGLSGKECDRLEAMCAEMAKIGRIVEKIRDFGLEWDGRSVPVTALPAFDSHGDHRMAMALAPAAIYMPGITVDGAEAVAKSYPGFWDDLRSVGFSVEEVTDEENAAGKEGNKGEDGKEGKEAEG